MSNLYCDFCKKNLLNKMSKSIHQLRCKSNPDFNQNKFKVPSRKGKYKNKSPSKTTLKKLESNDRLKLCIQSNNFICQYCLKDVTLTTKLNFNLYFKALRLHESMCGKNPQSKSVKYPTVHSEATKKKLRDINKGKFWTQEQKSAASERMKKVVLQHPESYSSSNRGRVKQIIIDQIKLLGKWELYFYLWAKENKINITKCNQSFPYTWNGNRIYFPDFYLPDENLYVEIKGYETDRDQAKWSAFPNKLGIIKKNEIKKIINKTFIGINEIPIYGATEGT